jgi:hypothetical protein
VPSLDGRARFTDNEILTAALLFREQGRVLWPEHVRLDRHSSRLSSHSVVKPSEISSFHQSVRAVSTALPWTHQRDAADRCTVAPLMVGITLHTPPRRGSGCTVVRRDNTPPPPCRLGRQIEEAGIWGFGEQLQILSPAVRHAARSTS